MTALIKIKSQPKEITACVLGCVLMAQGEIICKGKTIGWFKDLKNQLYLFDEETRRKL